MERVKTGVAGLDAIAFEGVPRHDSILVEGAPGQGDAGVPATAGRVPGADHGAKERARLLARPAR